MDQKFLGTCPDTESRLLPLKDNRVSMKSRVNDFYIVYLLQNSISSTMLGLFRPLVECENSWTAGCGVRSRHPTAQVTFLSVPTQPFSGLSQHLATLSACPTAALFPLESPNCDMNCRKGCLPPEQSTENIYNNKVRSNARQTSFRCQRSRTPAHTLPLRFLEN